MRHRRREQRLVEARARRLELALLPAAHLPHLEPRAPAARQLLLAEPLDRHLLDVLDALLALRLELLGELPLLVVLGVLGLRRQLRLEVAAQLGALRHELLAHLLQLRLELRALRLLLGEQLVGGLVHLARRLGALLVLPVAPPLGKRHREQRLVEARARRLELALLPAAHLPHLEPRRPTSRDLRLAEATRRHLREVLDALLLGLLLRGLLGFDLRCEVLARRRQLELAAARLLEQLLLLGDDRALGLELLAQLRQLGREPRLALLLPRERRRVLARKLGVLVGPPVRLPVVDARHELRPVHAARRRREHPLEARLLEPQVAPRRPAAEDLLLAHAARRHLVEVLDALLLGHLGLAHHLLLERRADADLVLELLHELLPLELGLGELGPHLVELLLQRRRRQAVLRLVPLPRLHLLRHAPVGLGRLPVAAPVRHARHQLGAQHLLRRRGEGTLLPALELPSFDPRLPSARQLLLAEAPPRALVEVVDALLLLRLHLLRQVLLP